MRKPLGLKGIRNLLILLSLVGINFLIGKTNTQYLYTTIPLTLYVILVLRAEKNSDKKNEIERNIRILWYISILLVMILGIRLFHIQVLKNETFNNRANNQADRKDLLVGNRGSVYASGKRMAYNVKEYKLIINPKVVAKNAELIEVLQVIDREYIKLGEDVSRRSIEKMSRAKSGSGYKILQKRIDEETAGKIIDELRSRKIHIGSAIELNMEIKRLYADRSLRETIGEVQETSYSKGEKIGINGIEREYERYLKGYTIERKSLFTNSRDMILPISKSQMEVSADGNDVHLTIDPYIQYILQDELEKQYKATDSEEAVGIVLDPNNGKIVALASYTKSRDLKNPVFQSQYEPGSTFKPMVVASALDDGLVYEGEVFDVGDGRIKKYRHTIKESSRSTKGEITLSQVLEKSSNVAMVLIAEKLENSRFETYLRDYGFGEKTGADFFGELSPRLRPAKKWDGLKKYTMAFGQGIVTTPIQLATAFASIVNGGVLYEPYLVEKVTTRSGEVVRRNSPSIKRQTIDRVTSNRMKEILRRVVADGTGKNAKVEGYDIGGKTGTAQISKAGGYEFREYLASFMGFFPVDNPEYVVLVMFKKPQGKTIYQKYGGVVAAPVFKNIASRIIKYRDMKPHERVNLAKIDLAMVKDEEIELEKMPKLVGKSARKALRAISYINAEVEVIGEGNVVKQVPKAGVDIEKIKKIKLYLE